MNYESHSEHELLKKQTNTLERKLKLFKYIWIISFVAVIASIWTFQASSESNSDTLRLRKLVIVDEKGVERVIIGAPVPDPIMLGKRFPRGGKASGILLFDEEGNERSGYITTDGYPNALFTLDSIASQQVLFMTEPHGPSTLQIWDRNKNSFRLNISGDSPTLKLTKDGDEMTINPFEMKNLFDSKKENNK